MKLLIASVMAGAAIVAAIHFEMYLAKLVEAEADTHTRLGELSPPQTPLTYFSGPEKRFRGELRSVVCRGCVVPSAKKLEDFAWETCKHATEQK